MGISTEETIVAVATGAATGMVAAVSWFVRLIPWKNKVDREITRLTAEIKSIHNDILEIQTNHLHHLKLKTDEIGAKTERILGILEGEDRQRRINITGNNN